MSEQTPNLGLPYILPSQAQKHVTHNEALQIIDGMANIAVTATLATPPASPSEGNVYVIAPSATDAWAGKDSQLAMFIDNAWTFLGPKAGWKAWFVEDQQVLAYNGTDWINPLSSGSLSMLGIEAVPDSTSRFALSSDASLFNNAGAGHQLKLNKAMATDTLSLIFQTGWSGRAEIGLAGSDSLQIKTSADGSAWALGLEVDSHGVVRTPARPVVSGSLNQGTIAPASGSFIGLDSLAISQGGFAHGSALSSGYGDELIVPATGYYALNFTAVLQASSSFSLECAVNNGSVAISMSSSAATADLRSWYAGGIVYMNAGDAVSLKSTGTLSIQTGWNSLVVNASML